MRFRLTELTRIALAKTVLIGVTAGQIARGDEPRQLAPGVVRVVESRAEASDTVSDTFSIHGLLEASQPWTPTTVPASETLHELAQRAVIHRPVWQLEFGFKPLRMLQAEWREADGSMRKGLVWYLVYYVRNTGQHLQPTPQKEGWETEFVATPSDHAVRFLPTFVLQAHDKKKAYVDRVRPQVLQAIHAREDSEVKLHNSVDISRIVLESSDTSDGKVWGVASWLDVDPQIDFFSVYVQGLTNAYRWQELRPGEFPAGAPADLTRRIQPKTLQINFYRPGDANHQHEDEVRLGPPSESDPSRQRQVLAMYRLDRPLEYLWVYR
ncbi:MAG: hypothetical protein O2931_06765 [Planctomycetota bacterium]|nr:hypothetical protein [Planctomycetota bacterium]